MIVTKPKPMQEMLELIEPYKNILILGCGICSADCHAGGEREVAEMEKLLKSQGKKVVGGVVIDSLCNVERVKRTVKKMKREVKKADALLIMSCGIAVQVTAELVDKPVLPALDTIFAGALERIGKYYEMCRLCGQCVVGEYGGICPVSRCPKSMLNGPCGGTREGQCEVDPDLECVWVVIYERLKALGVEGSLEAISKAKEHNKWMPPRSVTTGLEILKGKW